LRVEQTPMLEGVFELTCDFHLLDQLHIFPCEYIKPGTFLGFNANAMDRNSVEPKIQH
jgi:hypothetical protein